MLKGAVGASVGQTAAAAAAMLLVWLLPQADRARTPIPLPVERASNVFFARATINGLGPFWFTLDTGATLTVIDPAAAKRAGLVVRDAGRRTNVGITAGDVVVATTSGARIQVGGAPEFAPPQLFVVAVRANAGYLGHTVDGVLGTDFLHRHIVEFRYAESRVTLWPPSAVLKETTASVPFTMDGNLVIATATLTLPDGDHVPARLLIDTGSNGALTLTSPFVRRHRLTRRFPSRQASATVGINGIEFSPVVTLGSVAFGSVVLGAPNAALSQAVAGLNASEDFDGILGGELLRRFTVTVDYPAQRLILDDPRREGAGARSLQRSWPFDIIRTIKHDMIAGKLGELPASAPRTVEDKRREILTPGTSFVQRPLDRGSVTRSWNHDPQTAAAKEGEHENVYRWAD
jgi:predicted aspartyl protease